MTQDTPALEIKVKDLEANGRALTTLLDSVPSKEIKTILDIRYGLGGWAKIALERFPNARLIGYEQDYATADKAWVNYDRTSLHRKRFNPSAYRLTDLRTDLLLADFNLVTQKKRELLDQAIEGVAPRYVVFTDVCKSKLHLNYLSYGLEEASLERYWEGFTIEGYGLVAFASDHHTASSALYRRA